MTGIEKAILGALGGLSAVTVKYLGQDHATVCAHLLEGMDREIKSYIIGYIIITPILIFLGAFIAFISEEQKRMKLVAIAIAAPALITTWAGGTKFDSKIVLNFPIRSVYAQPLDSQPSNSQTTTWQQIKDGVGTFFGYRTGPKRYWVIVGSFKDRNDAQAFANKINSEDRTLGAWIGQKVPPNEYYPVIVGGYNLLDEARALKDKALTTEAVTEAYLSEGAKR
jgi:hypothetical protein